MHSEEFSQALKRLHIDAPYLARVFGIGEDQAQSWLADGPPREVVYVVRAALRGAAIIEPIREPFPGAADCLRQMGVGPVEWARWTGGNERTIRRFATGEKPPGPFARWMLHAGARGMLKSPRIAVRFDQKP